ncbi:hypothetical protein D3C87_1696110 [compost metagenome]
MGNDKISCLGWCFGIGMGHKVRYTDIFLVPNACYNGNGKLGHCPSDIVIVKDQKIRLRAPAPVNDNGIIRDSRIIDLDEFI